MRKFKLVVLSNPTDGQDAEYNDWYSNVHLADVVAVPGFTGAQRFKLTDPMGFEHKHRYLAIYEFEGDDPDPIVKEMLSRRDTPAMLISDALDLSTAVAGVFEPCSPVVSAPQPGKKLERAGAK